MFIRNHEKGQTLVLTAFCMVALLGFAAMATDVGVLFRSKRNMQIAADAAATAAALDYLYNGSVTSAQAAGQAAAAANGVTNGSGGAVVTINDPPSSGANAGIAGYFEAIVSTANPTYVMQVISNSSAVTVAARAVAGLPSASKACIYIADPTASDTFHLQGNTTVSTPGCGIYVNSSSSSAVKVTGNSSTINALYFDDFGSYSGHQTTPTGITTGAPSQSNPFGSVPTLTPASACTSGNTVVAALVTAANLAAASSASGVVCFSATNVSLSGGLNMPGSAGGIVYLFENGVKLATGNSVTLGSATASTSNGVTTFTNTLGACMYLYGVGASAGTLDQSSNNLLTIFAPTSGSYNGIAIMQPPSNTTQLQVQFGSNNETLDGYIYAPKAEVFLQDNGGGVTASGVVADTMYIKSSTLTVPSYNVANSVTTPLRAVSMVE